MRKIFVFVLFLFCGLSLRAQNIVMDQHCHAQACLFSSWNPNKAGDLLVAVVRTELKAHLPCESTNQQCGEGVLLVTDSNGNHWQPAYRDRDGLGSWVWYALNAKPGTNIVGVVTSEGFDYPPYNMLGGGDFVTNMMIVEYPPAIALDDSTWDQYYKGEGDDEPHSPPVTATTSETLLIAWTNNTEYNGAKGPLTMTPRPPFTLVSDDGVLAVAHSLVTIPGSYSFSGSYSGYALWFAGLVAFKMGTPEGEALPKHEPITAPRERRNDHILERKIPNESPVRKPTISFEHDADIYFDGAFVGSSPATFELTPGQYNIGFLITSFSRLKPLQITLRLTSPAHLSVNQGDERIAF